MPEAIIKRRKDANQMPKFITGIHIEEMNQKWADAYRMGKERSGGRNTFEKFLIHVIKIYAKDIRQNITSH
jgi:hypothetical protein